MISKLSWHSSHTLAPGEVAVICLRFETFNHSDTDNNYNACCCWRWLGKMVRLLWPIATAWSVEGGAGSLERY